MGTFRRHLAVVASALVIVAAMLAALGSGSVGEAQAATAATAAKAMPGIAAAIGEQAVAAAPALSGQSAQSSTAGAGYWHTSGNQIIDSDENPVRIAGINWYGFETPDEIAHGLWAQDYRTIIDDIKTLGYNTIRIPFSNQMEETPIVPRNLAFNNNSGPINTPLEGLNALQDLQVMVTYAGEEGLKVDTYAEGATWGTGNTATDIGLAYEQAGNAILAVDPGALIFCEGISEYPDSSSSTGYDATWWGGDLQGVAQYPVVLSSPGHVVYSAHDYGPVLYRQTWFNSSTTPASLDAVWNMYWGYIYADGIAPIWVGEFGTDNTAADIESTAAGSQGQWFESLVAYLTANQWMGWTYWALNGEDAYDLLDGNYDPAPVSSVKQDLLQAIQFPLPGAQNGTPPPTGSSAPVSCSAVYSLTNSWPGGFQAQLVLTNTGTSAISPWSLNWTFPGDEHISSMWTASYTQSGENVTATNESYNATIAPSTSVTIGFTGTYTNSDAAPTRFSVNGTACS